MKRKLPLFSVLFVTGISLAQTLPTTENYVQSRTYLEPVTATSTTAKQIHTVQYFDGLGRPKQVVNVKASPTGKDVVVPIEYDGFGRQVKDYLPIPQSGTQNGQIYASPLGNATSIYGQEKIYSEKILENSPLDRILQQKQVGNDWTNHPVQFGYDANNGTEVKKYVTTTTWSNNATTSSISISTDNGGKYPANQLYKNTVTDEDGNVSIEFKNGQGQTLLVRKNDGSQNVDTYYVYNEYDQLAFVVPPLAAVAPSLDQTTLNNLCYQYRYDGKNRLVEKKLPGKGWEYMVYDLADRLILTQDANLEGQGKWLITKYDKLGRVVYTGILPGCSRDCMQGQINTQVITENKDTTGFTRNGLQIYYTNVYFHNIESVLSVNYYDTYPTGSPAMPTTVLGQTTLSQDAQNSNISTKSLTTASYVKNIEDDNWTKTYTWYDQRGRAVGTHSINHLGGYTKTESELDFAGVVQQSIAYHKRLDSDTEKVITENFEYDHQNRLKKHYHQVDNQPQELLAENHYNELSQLDWKKVGNNLQQIDYAYNIRGWMTSINNPSNLGTDLFGYQIKYTNPMYTSLTTGKYNGNIAEIDWKSSQDNSLRRYSYQYDELNRLKIASFSEPNASIPQNNFFNEELTYDVNGNILNLKRNTKNIGNFAEQIDNLSYDYTGNRLNSVTDVSTNYLGYPDTSGSLMTYDNNGNMTKHEDKGILNIQYNYLNLPKYIQFNEYVSRFYGLGGPRGGGYFEIIYKDTSYKYRADGVKLQKKHIYFSGFSQQYDNAETTDYLDGFQYSTYIGNDPSSEITQSLKFVPTAEGYYNFENNKYIYNYVDHLGNVRISYFSGANGAEVLEESNYYPFGLKHEGYNALAGNSSYNYKYNGKELQETGMYDYGARFYMPDIGRWGVIDPLSEEYRRWSPYNYAVNNPIFFTDPDGRSTAPIYDTEGNLLGTDNEGLQGKAIVMKKEDFQQGMDHEEALTKSTYEPGKSENYGFDSKESFEKYANSYVNLKNRPDYDGKLTLGEANQWYRDGNGGPLFVDAGKINLSPVTVEDVQAEGGSMYKNYFISSNQETGRIYGTIKITLDDAATGTVSLGGSDRKVDDYDFDQKPRDGTIKRDVRNIGTAIGSVVAGKGKGYPIYTYGNGKIETKKK